MMPILFLLAIVLGSAGAQPKKPPPRYPWNIWRDYGLLVDGRDHGHYKTLDIDTLQWMAENLNFATDSSWCYDNDSANCAVYGRHYRGVDAATVCPKGWRLPTADDWRFLLHTAGDGHALTRLTSTSGWSTSPTSRIGRLLAKYVKPIPSPTLRLRAKKVPPPPPVVDPDPDSDDRLGFRILPSGLRVQPMVHHYTPTAGEGEASSVESADMKAHPTVGLEFGLRGYAAYFWSATTLDTVLAADADGQPGIEIHDVNTMEQFGFSVRCVKPNRIPVVPAQPSQGTPRRGW
jgi:hypothetical protein